MTDSQSALEVARKAGWDEGIENIETRVRTAIAALEEAGYIRRKHNMPRVFADSICCHYVHEAIEKIKTSRTFDEKAEEAGCKNGKLKSRCRNCSSKEMVLTNISNNRNGN